MNPGVFRKLDVDLPAEPTHDQRPWSVAGMLLALVMLIAIAYAYLKNAGKL